MSTAIPDTKARQKALEITNSFIVQAPAGSGKTELLVQRFLALSGKAVSKPEEIIAITFTRKAAAEMRRRIIEALQAAQNPPPETPHAYQTWLLAKSALQQDQKHNWQLLKNPNRLRILTIDALCAAITRQSPLFSGLGMATCLLEKEIESYYVEASRRLLSALEDTPALSSPLTKLLLHLDTRQDRIETLFINMLAKRDQWLPHIISGATSLDLNQVRHQLESNLSQIVKEMIEACDAAIPAMYRQEVFELVACVQGKDIEREAIKIEKQTHFWLALTTLLLTEKDTFRQKVDKRQGFPPEAKAMKQRMHALLEQLVPYTTFKESLAALRYLPQTCYTESQWDMLSALFTLLPMLVAELKVLFKEKNVCDFTEIALAANIALGDKDHPTDLTLVLDSQIRHLLVDEFQDTSLTQFHLLEKLTAAWEPNEGRTLFLVGDPMQSIYRFRAAEVGLFLKVQQEGLGTMQLETLKLQTNFRASRTLVDWINAQFSILFPKEADIQNGRVVFSPCVSIKEADHHSTVIHKKHPIPILNHPTHPVVDLVNQIQTDHPEHSIAILVRSRTHLKSILPALKQAELPFNAIEIDRLYEQSVVQDLLSLTGALLHIGDRLSWLAILRAPWCGLTLDDLFHLTHLEGFENTPFDPLWTVLRQLNWVNHLSLEGKQRLQQVIPILEKALSDRGRLPLRRWVENTWKALEGPDYLSHPEEWNSAMLYFKLLDSFDQIGEVPDLQTIRQTVERHYTSPPTDANNRLHVMTIHKAKGLEFDTVILPQLESGSQHDEAQLLLWLERPSSELILAPIKASSETSDPIYRWLQYTEQTKARQELIRLLYVAVTRAKQNIYLLAMDSDKQPSLNSFLGLLANGGKST